jgi:hypothetical protein
MKSSVGLPIFTSGHPLALSTSLISRGYKPIIYTMKRGVFKKPRGKQVFIIISIYDIEDLKKALTDANFSTTRVIVFVSWGELKKHPRAMFSGPKYSKKDIHTFIPYTFSIKTLKGPSMHQLQNQNFVKRFAESTRILRQRLTINSGGLHERG